MRYVVVNWVILQLNGICIWWVPWKIFHFFVSSHLRQHENKAARLQINWSKFILYSSWLSCFVQNCQMIYHLRRHKNCRLKQTLTYVSISQRIKTKSFHEKTKLLAFYLRCKSLFLNMSNKCHINNIFFFLSWLTVKVREETLTILRITKTSLWVTNICRAKIILISDEICH